MSDAASKYSYPTCCKCGVRMIQSEFQLGKDMDGPKPWYCPNCGFYTDEPLWDYFYRQFDEWNAESHNKAAKKFPPLQ